LRGGERTTVKRGNWGVSYELPDPIYERLRKRAEEEGVSISQIIRRILEERLSERDGP